MKVTGRETVHDPPDQTATLKREAFTLRSARYNIPHAKGSGHWELMQLAPDLLVVLTTATYVDRLELAAAGEGSLEFHFQLSGKMLWNVGLIDGQRLEQPSLFIVRQPLGLEVPEIIEAGTPGGSVTVYCRPATLRRILGEYQSFLSRATAEAISDNFDGLFSMRMALYPALSKIVAELSALRATGALRLAFAEALVQQLLCETVQALADDPGGTERFDRLTDRDVRGLRTARALLMQEFTPPPTIDQIARRTGLGTKKLKIGFRMLFGKSVHSFANDLRMNRGLELLRKSDMSIAAVAEALGYSFQTSFTKAFKQKFGVLPKDFRHNPLIL